MRREEYTNRTKPQTRGRAVGNGVRAGVVAALATVVSACSGTSALNPAGTRAAEIARLWWLMFGLGVVIYAIIIGLLLRGLYARRRHEEQAGETPRTRRWILLGGILLPAIVLVIVYAYAVRTINVLAAEQPAGDTIEVIGRQWWWEIRYPNGTVTANEVHIPVGQSVELRLTSNDVIHSLWVPQLMGKLDLIPGKRNAVWLKADRPGEYLGECAEYCGTQHARMRLVVVAEQPADYLAWLASQQKPAVEPATEQLRAGQQVFLGSACVYCHTVKGTNATGTVGPDLTHLASRRTLGAGIMPNVPGNLAGWVVNSQALKPGNRMPPMYIEAQDLQDLLAYLQSLQ